MKKTAHTFTKSEASIPVTELDHCTIDWLTYCQLEGHSPHTITTRRVILDKFLWFLRERQYTHCSLFELRQFFAYLDKGHEIPGGRWGNPQLTRPLRPWTKETYYRHVRTLFRWMMEEGIIDTSPMEGRGIPRPIVRADQIQPLSAEQISALIQAASHSRHPHRDEALIRFLHDTGVRASEFCGLKMTDLNWGDRCCKVLGKGNKYRTVYYGKRTYKALWAYLREDLRHSQMEESNEPLFLSDRGSSAGEPLTRSGLFQLVQRLGAVAGIRGVRCSPHTLRHTFALNFLQAGGSVFTLKLLLGHSSLHMTNRYVALAQGDLQKQHRSFSPGDHLTKRSS